MCDCTCGLRLVVKWFSLKLVHQGLNHEPPSHPPPKSISPSSPLSQKKKKTHPCVIEPIKVIVWKKLLTICFILRLGGDIFLHLWEYDHRNVGLLDLYLYFLYFLFSRFYEENNENNIFFFFLHNIIKTREYKEWK